MNNMKILFISLGCDKNLVDSEHMLGLLVEHGFEITDSEEDAEVIVINTCCFIHDAKEESIQNILEMAKYRTAGSCKVLLVTGCMAERYRDEIIEEIPEVDAVLGTNSYDKILDAIQDVLGGDRFQEYADLKGLPKIDAQRVVTTGGHYEYLKIAEGCDKHCTYCIIPKLRGPYRSVPMEELIAEAKTMAEQGVKELVLVAQETTIYGIDLYGKPSLHLLLKELCKIQELYWIRILYCYPEDIYPELVQTMKEEPKVMILQQISQCLCVIQCIALVGTLTGTEDQAVLFCLGQCQLVGNATFLQIGKGRATHMPPGLKGKVDMVDDAGQIHVNWENGSSLALVPAVDSFHIPDLPKAERPKQQPSR